MNYLSVENVSKEYGVRVLFRELSFGLSKGDKAALVANNGSGKSTLLRILAGQDQSDSGSVTIRNGIRIGYLEQEPSLDGEQTIQQLLNGSSSKVLKLIRAYETAIEKQAEDNSEENQRIFEQASANMEKYDAWDYERKVKAMLSRFNIEQLDQQIKTLSGGQKKRLALAFVLLDNPDLLILDEPTNHLDVEMIEWLESYLGKSPVTLLMVTHDRYFLDRVCNNIFELTDGKLYHHTGNYTYFLQKRTEREEVYKTETEKAGKLMKKELDWMRRMPKARTTKSKSRIKSFYELKDKATGKKATDDLKLGVKMSRIGGKVLELKKVYKSYGEEKILSGFDYSFSKGERIGIVGKNGSGKTTFLNIITGNEEPDSGKVNTGETIVFGYYSQSGMELKEDKRVIEVVKDIAEVITMGNGTKLTASQFLQYFMFPPEMQYTFVSKLSGGEKRRLYLLTVLVRNPNFLILDEPTNDLDLLTLNKLEEFLLNYQGCVILVSHDRYFMDKLTDHLFIFKGNGVIRDFIGNYTEYRDKALEDKKQEKKEAAEEKAVAKEDKNSGNHSKNKVSFKDKYEYEQLEKEIEALEQEKKTLEKALDAPDLPIDELNKKSERLGVVIAQTEEKTLRWMELGEMMPS